MATVSKSDRPSVNIELGDHKLLRRELEAETLKAAEEFGLQASYVEDNIHLFLSTLILLCGAAAHLLPGKFPSHRNELLICVAAYYALSSLSFLFSWCVVKDDFLILCASEKHKTARMRVGLGMKRFDTDFTLKLSTKQGKFVSSTVSVEKFFHEDGYIARSQYHAWVRKQLEAYKSQLKLT